MRRISSDLVPASQLHHTHPRTRAFEHPRTHSSVALEAFFPYHTVTMGPQQSVPIGLSGSLFNVSALFLFKSKYQSEMVREKKSRPGTGSFQ